MMMVCIVPWSIVWEGMQHYLYSHGSIQIDLISSTNEKLSVLLKCDFVLFPTEDLIPALLFTTKLPPPPPLNK